VDLHALDNEVGEEVVVEEEERERRERRRRKKLKRVGLVFLLGGIVNYVAMILEREGDRERKVFEERYE